MLYVDLGLLTLAALLCCGAVYWLCDWLLCQADLEYLWRIVAVTKLAARSQAYVAVTLKSVRTLRASEPGRLYLTRACDRAEIELQQYAASLPAT